MKSIRKTTTIFSFSALILLTNCISGPQESLHRKKMKDWREANKEVKMNTCMDFIRIWKEKQGEQITVESQEADAIKLVNCLDQGIQEMPKSVIDTMNISQCAVSCCQYVIYGSIK